MVDDTITFETEPSYLSEYIFIHINIYVDVDGHGVSIPEQPPSIHLIYIYKTRPTCIKSFIERLYYFDINHNKVEQSKNRLTHTHIKSRYQFKVMPLQDEWVKRNSKKQARFLRISNAEFRTLASLTGHGINIKNHQLSFFHLNLDIDKVICWDSEQSQQISRGDAKAITHLHWPWLKKALIQSNAEALCLDLLPKRVPLCTLI